MKKLSISKKRVKNITFTTVKKGKADLKKDGGTVRGRHIVRVTMMVGNDYKTIAGLDLNKMQASYYMDHYDSVREKTGLDFSTLDFGCAWKSRSLLEGLEQSFNGENDYSTHLETYNSHPSGVRGVLIHKETGNLYIMGVVLEEEIIQHDPKGNARKTKGSERGAIVKGIQEELGLLSGKWRMYQLPKDTTINGLGVEDKLEEPKGLRLYAILDKDNEVVKTSKGRYYFTREVARQARKEVSRKKRGVRIAVATFTPSEWETAK